MSTSPTDLTYLPGVHARTVPTQRYAAHVLQTNPDADGTPVVFVHGNISSSAFWQPTMLALAGVRSIAIDLRGFGGSQTLPVDATRGVGDYADDVHAVLDALGVDRAVLVGWSMGGGVVMQMLIDRPGLVDGLVLVSPVSPYGFGGTAADGSLLTPDGAGTGGGGANPDFVQRLVDGDTTAAEQTSPRSVFRAAYVAPGYTSDHEDRWVASMLTTAVGPGSYPGDSVGSDHWPGFAAGDHGVLNTMAPTHFDVSGIVDVADKPPVLWIRGELDAIVSDASFFDLNLLGQAGIVPGWPGADVAPPQPMIAQTRAVWDRYAAAGGRYRELVLPGTGHSAHLEQPEAFTAALVELLDRQPD